MPTKEVLKDAFTLLLIGAVVVIGDRVLRDLLRR